MYYVKFRFKYKDAFMIICFFVSLLFPRLMFRPGFFNIITNYTNNSSKNLFYIFLELRFYTVNVLRFWNDPYIWIYYMNSLLLNIKTKNNNCLLLLKNHWGYAGAVWLLVLVFNHSPLPVIYLAEIMNVLISMQWRWCIY